MFQKFARLAFVLNLGLILSSCAPAITEDSVDTSPEASQFRKTATGVWTSECLRILENGVIAYEQRKIEIDSKSVQMQFSEFSNSKCTTQTRVEKISGTIKIRDTDSETKVVLDIINDTKSSLQFYRQTLETQIMFNGSMRMKLLGMSVWENGEELFLPERDLDPVRERSYKQITN